MDSVLNFGCCGTRLGTTVIDQVVNYEILCKYELVLLLLLIFQFLFKYIIELVHLVEIEPFLEDLIKFCLSMYVYYMKSIILLRNF